MANCIFVSNDDLERYSKELGISKLAVHATIMLMTEGKEVDSIPSSQEVKEYRQRNNIIAKATDNILSEMASIKQQAIANGTFMKAPNGRPTNLTESQWLQVRTKAFKDWFGDWENDPANASKVVDENGEPLVTYHTSPHSEFSSFDTRDRRIEINPDGSYDRSMMAFVYDMSDEEIDEAIRDYENNGGTSIYTAKSKEVSSSYAKTESQMFDIRERDIIDNADSWIEQDDLAKEGLYDEAFAFARVRDQWTGEVDKSREEVLRSRFGLSKEEFDEKLKEIDAYLESKTEKFTESNKFELFEDYVNKKMKSLRHNYSNDYNSSSDEIIGSQYALFVKMKNPLIVDAKGNNWNEIQYKGKIESTRTLEKIAKDNGYDGVIVKNVYDIGGEMSFPEATDVFSVRDANSVKSATDNNGEFSGGKDDIYQEGEIVDSTAKRDARLDSLFEKQRVSGKVTIADLISLIDGNSEFSSIIDLLKTKKDGRKALLSGVKVALSEGDIHDVFKGRRAFYDSSTKTIYINTLGLFNNGNADSVILHEILHSITVNRILGNQAYRKEFDKIINEYNKHFYTSRYSKSSLNNEDSSHYMEEFIADIWSNRRLIEQLKSIKSTSKLTLWDKIKRFFTKIFAGSDGTLMADASDILYRLLDSPEAVGSGDMYYEGEQAQQPQQAQHAQYQSVKITESTGGYAQRTKENAAWSDVTIAFAQNFDTAGEKLTAKAAGKKYVSYHLALPDVEERSLGELYKDGAKVAASTILEDIKSKGLPTKDIKLNIAGNGIYSLYYAQSYINDFVTDVIKELQNLGVTIAEIRSGGQTGIDEAGIIAAQRLVIPASVHAPKGFVFRTKDGKDIADRAAFESRFNQAQQSQQNSIPASYEGKITPDANTVFVFGSNPEGRHGAGAAKVAREQFGAVYGQGEGLQGNAYALPTKDLRVKENNGLKSISPEQIIENIKKMYGVARQNPNKQFKVAYTNGLNETTLNGYTGREMIQMFKDAGPIPSNVVFSKNWTNHWNETGQQQSIEEKEESPIITSQQLTTQRNSLSAAYTNPVQKRDRTQAIARKFSELLDEKYNQAREDALKKVKEAEEAKDDEKAASLYADYALLTKQSFLSDYGVRNLFNDIYNQYNPENVTPEEERNIYIDLYGEEPSESELTKQVQYKKDEYKKVQENFWPLAEEATLEIKKLERIIIDITSPNSLKKEEVTSPDIMEEANQNPDDNGSSASQEEKAPESWMNSFRSIPNITSLSQRTRDALMKLYESTTEGAPVLTDLQEMRHIDPEHAHAVILFGLSDMTCSDDFEPALIKLGKKYPFVRQLFREGEDGKYQGMLAEDPQLKAAFYQDFRKDATSYWASRSRRDPNGYYEKDTTFPLNSRENTAWLLSSWKYNTEGGRTIGGQESIFNADGTLNKKAIETLAEGKVKSLLGGLNKIKTEDTGTKNAEISDFLDTINPSYRKSNWEVFMDVLHAIGIDQESEELKWALVDYKMSEGLPVGMPAVLAQVTEILGAARNDKYYKEDPETHKLPEVDILSEFSGNYTKIAETISYIGSDATEGSFYHLDKTRNSYTTPNYLGRVMKELSDIHDDEDRFNNYVEQNYGRFSWFKKDGVWLNSWLKELTENKELRKKFKHKVVLDFNKKGFFETDELGHALGLLREFNAPLVSKNAGYELAWYYVPILSDTDSAEFIQFTKDTGEDYKDNILNKMKLTVIQEWNRIKLVRERAANGAAKIANFDKRGLEFCFFPALNTWSNESGSFIEQMESLSKQKDEAKKNNDSTKVTQINAQTTALIKEALQDIIERDVDATYANFRELGVFDKDGDKFKYLKGYKDIDTQIRGNIDYIKSTLEKVDREKYPGFVTLAEKYLANPYSVSWSRRKQLFELASQLNGERVPRVESNNHREMISKYVYNSRFATSQIEQIFATDLAYYKNATDFQKRFKEIHAPSLRLYTKAEFNGERVGKDIEKSLYLADENILSNTYEHLKEALKERVDDHTLTSAARDYILKKYENINSSDAQAYRTLDSYRAMMVMSGQWDDTQEQAYKNFQDPSGKWTIEDFSQIFQTKKPYLYTQQAIDSQVKGELIKMGIQHKNSEFLLLAMLPKLVQGTSMADSFKLRAIDKFMHDNDIDVVNFTSAVKVGNQGVIDLNFKDPSFYKLKETLDKQIRKGEISKDEYDKALSEGKFKTEEEIIEYLNEITAKGTNPITVHSASYEDYGIQTQTPEHIIDHEQLLGTQIRRLIGADITPGTILNVAGVSMTAEEWWKVYNGILVDNIAQSFDEVSEKFNSPEKLEQLLIETIKGNERYPNDLVNAVRIVDGKFNIPLFDTSTAELVESLINSIIKDNVTKQKIRGGSCIQVSSFGLSDKLSLVYDTDSNGKKRIKYMECFMPAYSKKFFKAFMKKSGDGYILDMNDLPEELRYAIGYRVPTEDKYSMAPLYIKGFLPQQNGSAIMLPAEITTLSGSDFDVDKMYIMLPEFDTIEYDKDKAHEDFKKYSKQYNRDIDDTWELYFDAIINDEDIDEYSDIQGIGTAKTFKDWWKENKENYRLAKPKFRKIKGTFNADKDGKNASFDDGLSKIKEPNKADLARARKKRNNAIIDMMFSVLTNSDTLARFVKPGGYDEVKKQALIEQVLENASYDALCKKFEIESGNLASHLNNMGIKELEGLADEYSKTLDPLSPLTQMHFHKQNSAGAKAIGIYAVNNAGQALLQHSELDLSRNNDPSALQSIDLFGKSYSSLHEIKNEEGEYITNNMAQYLAAAVDNGKDPTLEYNGQNDFTFNISNMLIRLGYRHREVAAITNQPIIKELAAAVTKGIADGESKDVVIRNVLEKYAKAAGIAESMIDTTNSIKDMTLEQMYKDRSKGVTKDTAYYGRQFNIGLWFKNAESTATFVNTVTQNLRADAQNGAAGPRVMDTVLREIKIEQSVTDVKGLYDSTKTLSIEDMKGNPLGFLAAFQQFGIKRTKEILKKYFPQYNDRFVGDLKDIMERTKYNNMSVDTAQKLFDAGVIYGLSHLPVFNSIKGVQKTPQEVAHYFLYDFPEQFSKAKNTNPVVYQDNGEDVHFNDIPFIKGLKVVPKSKRNVIQTIVLDSTGRLSKDGKAKMMQSWESLMYTGDERAKNLAINLFAYSIIRYGGKYTPTGFAHLIPTAVKEGVKGYQDALNNMRENGAFVNRILFLRNNTEDRTLFPKLSDREAKTLMDLYEKGTPVSGMANGREITCDTEEFNKSIPSVVKVKEVITNEGKKTFATFRNGVFVSSKDEEGNTKKQFYILEPTTTTTAVMIPIEPLGAKGNIVEYFLDDPYSKSLVEVSSEYEEENPDIDIPEAEPQEESAEVRYKTDDNTDDLGDNVCVSIIKQ